MGRAEAEQELNRAVAVLGWSAVRRQRPRVSRWPGARRAHLQERLCLQELEKMLFSAQLKEICMTQRIPLLLLACALLLTPPLSASDAPSFLAPSACPAMSSPLELPIFGPAESVELIGPLPPQRCGACGACWGLNAGADCTPPPGGGRRWICYVTDQCSNGEYQCGCSATPQ